MKAFDQLTDRGKVRRLRRVALYALAHYDLDIERVRFVSNWTNGIFRLYARNGASYVLRVCAPDWRTEADLRAEITWLRALKKDTDIPVPAPITTRHGRDFVEESTEGLAGPLRCALMEWLPGSVLLGDRLNEKNLYRMGRLFARLHAHTATFKPPRGFSTLKIDHPYVRRGADILFDDEHRKAFTPHTRDIFTRAWDQVQTAYTRLYADPAGLRVIHNDLHHENIKIYRGELYPYDFEDTVWGYPVQDIATALLDLVTDVPREVYPTLRAAFRQGYESHSPWPETYAEEIDTFQAGVLFGKMNYVLWNERQYLQQALDYWGGYLQPFLEAGAIGKPRD